MEFRVTAIYLLLFAAFPLVRWRKSRTGPRLLGAPECRQDRLARLVAWSCFLAPLGLYFTGMDVRILQPLLITPVIRWLAVAPAACAVVLILWACRSTEPPADGEAGFPLQRGPYRRLRHPIFAGIALFFLSLSILSDSGLVIAGAILGALTLRLKVATAVDRQMVEQFEGVYEAYMDRTGCFLPQVGKLEDAYVVPRRFSLSAVLTLLTAFVLLFGALNYMNAPPVVYLFVASEIVAICLVQIVFGSTPRGASALTGAVLLPFWTWVLLPARRLGIPAEILLLAWALLVALGGLLGYCVGALAAGFFLVADLIEPWILPRQDEQAVGPPHDLPREEPPAAAGTDSLP